MLIDAHCHFWNPARGDYGWLMAGPDSLAPLRHVFAPADLAKLNGGARVIVVQAADTVAETEYLLGLAAQNPQIVGVVGWVDLARETAAQTIAHLANNPRLKGLRPMLQDIADSRWILTAPKPEAIKAMVAHGLRFDALVQTRHLAPLAEFAARWPDLQIVIDHCAKPTMSGGLADEWVQGIKALSKHPQVMCKLSGLLTELPAGHTDRLAALRPVVDLVLDLFGPSRVMWGSDWPVLTLAASYHDWTQMTDALLAGLTSAKRAQVMGQTAATFYAIGDANA